MTDEDSIWTMPAASEPVPDIEAEPEVDADLSQPRRHVRVGWLLLGGVFIVVGAIALLAGLARQGDEDPTPSGDAAAAGGRMEQGTTDGSAAADPEAAAGTGWPAEVNGRPPMFGEMGTPPGAAPEGAPRGVYLWSDFDGWHLWVVQDPSDPQVVGTVASNDEVASSQVEGDAGGTTSAEDKVVSFDLGADGAAVSGIRFNPGFFARTLIVTLGDVGVPIYAGAASVPVAMPYVISQ